MFCADGRTVCFGLNSAHLSYDLTMNNFLVEKMSKNVLLCKKVRKTCSRYDKFLDIEGRCRV